MKKFKFITLGCKSNQFESDSISMQLKDKGYEESNDNPELIIVNTCTVTSKAGMQSRQAIRNAAKQNPGARIIVTGCHSQIAPEEILEIKGVSKIVDQEHKNIIPAIIEKPEMESFGQVEGNASCNDKKFRFMPSGNFGGRTRAYLKIQDGCNAFCSYCIIPYARGRSRSMDFDDVVNELKILKDSGYKEVVLTGIHIGYYGEDLENKTSFTNLIKYIAHNKNDFPRIRISSIEPREITDEIIEIASEDSILCPHFHIPFQNGDDYILKRMNRPYNSQFLYDLTKKISNKIPDVSIGADIIFGFPGETEESFNNTYSLLKDLPVSYMHVFPYSPRKNTPAAGFKDQVNGKLVKPRTQAVRELSDLKKQEFYKSQSGKTKEVLFENHRDKNGFLKGFSQNYVQAFLDSNDDKLKNSVVKVKLEYNEESGLMESKLI